MNSGESDSIQKHKDFLFPAVAMYYQEPIALERGEGMYVWDEGGNKPQASATFTRTSPKPSSIRSKSSITLRRFTPTGRNLGSLRNWPR